MSGLYKISGMFATLLPTVYPESAPEARCDVLRKVVNRQKNVHPSILSNQKKSVALLAFNENFRGRTEVTPPPPPTFNPSRSFFGPGPRGAGPRTGVGAGGVVLRRAAQRRVLSAPAETLRRCVGTTEAQGGDTQFP